MSVRWFNAHATADLRTFSVLLSTRTKAYSLCGNRFNIPTCNSVCNLSLQELFVMGVVFLALLQLGKLDVYLNVSHKRSALQVDEQTIYVTANNDFDHLIYASQTS